MGHNITDTVMRHQSPETADAEAERSHQQFLAQCKDEYTTLQQFIDSPGYKYMQTKLAQDERDLLEKMELAHSETQLAKLVGSLLACKGQQEFARRRLSALHAVLTE